MIGPTVDLIWVGKLGATPIAGVGVAGMAVMLVNSMMLGLAVGVRAMVARFVGAGDYSGANHLARQGFVIGASIAVILATIGIFFTEQLLMLFGLEPNVVIEGAAYMRIMFVGSVTMAFRTISESIMQSSGDPITPMKIAIIFRLFHVVFCPFLVFGWWIFPQLGVSGAALTNVIAQTLGLILALWVLTSGHTRLRLSLRNFRLDPHTIWRIVKIGIPSSIMSTERSLGHLVLMWFMVPFGTLAVAAHTLCQRVDMILIMIGIGLGHGAGVLVGQNLGALKPERAERSAWIATSLAEIFAITCSLAMLLWAESIVRIFSTDPEIVELTAIFLRIGVAGYMIMGFPSVLQNSISGAGDTVPPMLFTLLVIWLVQIPLAVILPQVAGLGVFGVRWAIVVGMIVGAAAYIVYFKLGRWKRKEV